MFGKKDKEKGKVFDTESDEIKLLKEKLEYLDEKIDKLEKKFTEAKKPKEDKKQGHKFVSTIKGFIDNESFGKLQAICSDIASKDETFIYDTNIEANEIYIYSEDKNQLHKKSMWLINKTGIEDLKYTIE